ncbi:MAG: hypothetical protein ICV64_08960 [Thermoleophilia bacterium]|nr:hypothetical protein [Thermoleophilia bacterium]
MLVSVRATLAAPARWTRVNATYFGAQRNIIDAVVSVRVERTGTPVFFARMRGSATALWLSSRCS